jgi:serine/threonine protein kinase
MAVSEAGAMIDHLTVDRCGDLKGGAAPTDGTRTPTTGCVSEQTSRSTSQNSKPFYTPSCSAQTDLGDFDFVPEASEENDDPCATDLNYFHKSAKFHTQLSAGHFTVVKYLTECCAGHGHVELQRWRSIAPSIETAADQKSELGDLVVVKRVKTSRVFANCGEEPNERALRGHYSSRRIAEDTLSEIGIYCALAQRADMPLYISRLYAAFKTETEVWMVVENADGGDMFNAVQNSGGSLPAHQFMPWCWQLMQAVFYLHKLRIAHRDISIENVLICKGAVRLMDFGQAVLSSRSRREGTSLRCFGLTGKPYYRSPECYVPPSANVDVTVPKDSKPGDIIFTRTLCRRFFCEVRLPPSAVPGTRCAAETWGYAPAPADIFACGVCIFVMATGAPPWRQATLQDPHFAWVDTQGITKLLQAWNKPQPVAEELMEHMLVSNPTKRFSAEACLGHQWFAPFSGKAVPVHSDSSYPAALAAIQADKGLGFKHVSEDTTMSSDFYGHEEVKRGAVAASLLSSAAAIVLEQDAYNSEMTFEDSRENPFFADHYSNEADYGDVYRSADVHNHMGEMSHNPFAEFSADKAPPPLPLSMLQRSCIQRVDGTALSRSARAEPVTRDRIEKEFPIPPATAASKLQITKGSGCQRSKRPHTAPSISAFARDTPHVCHAVEKGRQHRANSTTRRWDVAEAGCDARRTFSKGGLSRVASLPPGQLMPANAKICAGSAALWMRGRKSP